MQPSPEDQPPDTAEGSADGPADGPVEEPVEQFFGPRFGFRAPTLIRTPVRLPGWAGRKRVVHITDLHFGNVTPISLQREAIALANAAAPDLTVLTGDFVARGLRHLERLTRTLAAIKGDKIAVLGNHDYWMDHVAVIRALEAANVEVISNGWTVHGSGQDALAIACLDDFGTDHHDIDHATKDLLGRPSLALSHNPEAAPQMWGRGAGLVLSGHTHGGQLHVPRWTRSVWESLLKARFVDGWYTEDGAQLFVNPGVGSSVVPWRYGRPAMRSVAILDLEGGPLVSAS